MSYNSFDYYNQIRQYQLHLQKVANPQTKVPKHEAFKPYKPNIQRAKEYQRNRRIEQIERQNEQIMSKLLNINKRGMQISKSSSSLSLPKIKKQVNIPLYEQENNQIARRIIQSKSNINTLGMIDRYRSVEQRKKNISKYHSQDGVLVNRKKYLAQLMLLKKMRVSEVMANSK